MRKVALSFLAHPDDAEILCAGTLIRLRDAGWEIHIATATPGDCGTMNQNCWDISSIRKTIDLFRRITPSLVFAHAPRDYMLDHEQSSLLARGASFIFGAPNSSLVPRHPDSHVPHLYYCDPVEGTDPLGEPVTPSTLVDVSAQIETKAAMLALHASQREWLRAHHGMDEYIESMRRHGAMRGKLAGTQYAEGFIQHRGHPYPQNDLLSELFGVRK
jgi:LmbE family N-acetylglucosaminyl deacetylase